MKRSQVFIDSARKAPFTMYHVLPLPLSSILSNTCNLCTSGFRLASTVWYCCARAIPYVLRARTVPPGPVWIPK